MTAHAYDEERENCLDAGMNDLITKPVEPYVLFSKLASYLAVAPESSNSPSQQMDGSRQPTISGHRRGLDIETGLFYVDGNRQVYLRMLEKFKTKFSDVASHISSAIAANDLAEARRLAHLLRGSAKTIGAESLFDTSAALEQALKEGKIEELQALTELLALHLEKIMADVATELAV